MDSKFLKSLIKKKPEEPANTRLQSLRLPRDLSLGGTKPKKVFVPNVNVVRNKDKAKEIIKNLDRKRKEKGKNEPRNKNVGDSERFLQSSGIFSDGTAEQRKSAGYSDRTVYTKSEYDPSGALAVPTYKKSKWMVDKEKEDVILDELISQDEDKEDEKMSLVPILIQNFENGPEVAVKTENKINGDHMEVHSEAAPHYFKKVDEDSDFSKLSLFKLPDSLAGKGLSDDPNVKKLFDYPLSVMLEGKIGTLQIKRSGKMYMKIGHVKYLVEPTDYFSSQETIATYKEQKYYLSKPKIAVLGNIEQKFDVTPIWNYLLQP